MRKGIRRLSIFIILGTLALAIVQNDDKLIAFAKAFSAESLAVQKKETEHFVKASTRKSNNNYSSSDPIGNSDPHFGFELGQFVIRGYSWIEDDGKGNILVVKGEDDQVRLTYDLRKDIDDLRGDGSHQRINSDGDGSDQPFGYATPKNGFGRGALIWRFTDSTGKTGAVKSHTDYFLAMGSGAANKEIVLNEEGDWSFALDYEVQSPSWFFGAKTWYDRYTVRFNIRVRNANCMIYLKDAASGSELRDKAHTKSGFSIDLANSRYLKVDVVREDAEGNEVRGNSVYSDGAVFTEKGIYRISVKNVYTGAETNKTIVVD